jgi:hypothetical protein
VAEHGRLFSAGCSSWNEDEDSLDDPLFPE